MSRRLRITPPGTHRAAKLKFAAENRRAPTLAEGELWKALRRRQVAGYHFRRQQVIAGFIVDFYCARARLAVEVDGRYHDHPDQQRRDLRRTAILEEAGVHVLRVTNEAVFNDLDRVVQTIADACGGQFAARFGASSRRRRV